MSSKILVALMLYFALCISCAEEQTTSKPQIQQPQTQHPSVRNAHSMAYDSVNKRLVLFGGADHEKVLSDLWVYKTDNWLQLQRKTTPPPRTFASLVFDEHNNQLLLFGGNRVLFGEKTDASNLLNDTWIFKNDRWHKLNLPVSPQPRAEAGIVYDRSTNQVVLFGGYTIQKDAYVKLADTWVFKNEQWHQEHTEGPTARHGVAMWYDTKDEQVLLFGGSTVDRQYGAATGETWALENNAWKKLPVQQPEGLFNPAAAYDRSMSSLLLFGGWEGTKRVNKTSRFKDQKWQEIALPVSPTPRNHSQMIFDEAKSRFLLFGGHDGERVFGDLWEFKDNSWIKLTGVQSLARIVNAH
ncbi:MAG: Kelch repeat-containing protein [Calditrichia bacterium]